MTGYTFDSAAYKVIRLLGGPVIRSVFHFTGEKLQNIPGPFLMLANHNSDLDPAFLGIASPHQMYFVATEKILRMGMLTGLVTTLFKPIIHYKGKAGISSTKEILAKLRDGRNVALFPEGNRSFNGLSGDFPPATGKLVKKSGATLVTYRLHGGYLTTPRWSTSLRKGKLWGEIAGIYSPEKLKAMTEDEVNRAIRNDLFVDAYADQKKSPIPYRGRDLALGLESTLFSCPQCGTISSLHSEGNTIRCAACGYEAVYDVYGLLQESTGNVSTVTQLDLLQQNKIRQLLSSPETAELFHDEVTVETIGPDHKTVSSEKAELSAYTDRLILGERTLLFSRISGMAINQRNLLIIHLSEGNEHLELSGNISFSALKYLYLYQFARKKIHEKI